MRRLMLRVLSRLQSIGWIVMNSVGIWKRFTWSDIPSKGGSQAFERHSEVVACGIQWRCTQITSTEEPAAKDRRRLHFFVLSSVMKMSYWTAMQRNLILARFFTNRCNRLSGWEQCIARNEDNTKCSKYFWEHGYVFNDDTAIILMPTPFVAYPVHKVLMGCSSKPRWGQLQKVHTVGKFLPVKLSVDFMLRSSAVGNWSFVYCSTGTIEIYVKEAW